MKMIHRGEKGFTLIELLIVVAILGIIAAVVIPNVVSFMVTGQLSAANNEVEQVKTARLAYFGEHGRWPNSTRQLVPMFLSGTLRSDYVFDGAYGWIIGVANSTWPESIVFRGWGEGEGGRDGKWERR